MRNGSLTTLILSLIYMTIVQWPISEMPIPVAVSHIGLQYHMHISNWGPHSCSSSRQGEDHSVLCTMSTQPLQCIHNYSAQSHQRPVNSLTNVHNSLLIVHVQITLVEVPPPLLTLFAPLQRTSFPQWICPLYIRTVIQKLLFFGTIWGNLNQCDKTYNILDNISPHLCWFAPILHSAGIFANYTSKIM